MRDGGAGARRAGSRRSPRRSTCVFVTTREAAGSVAHPRNLIVVERRRARIGDRELRHAGAGERYFTNAVTEVVVGAGARLEHNRIQRESERAFHVGPTTCEQAARQPLSLVLARDGRRAGAAQPTRALDDEGIETLHNGLYLTRGEQLVDNQTGSITPSPTATAASSTRASSTATRTACSTARCTSIRRRRRPTASRRTRTCC